MSRKLEVMMFNICQTVTHVGFPAGNDLAPEYSAIAEDPHFARYFVKLIFYDEFRADTARPQFRSGKVEVIALFEFVIGKFVALRETQAKRHASLVHEIDAGK